jgi:hypothetical protein
MESAASSRYELAVCDIDDGVADVPAVPELLGSGLFLGLAFESMYLVSLVPEVAVAPVVPVAVWPVT